MAAGPIVGILAAAGSGERLGMGEPKALAPCAGRPLYEWSLDPLAAECDRVVVALPPGVDRLWDGPPSIEPVTGGASRSASVLVAARSAPDARSYVVHDAARPLLTRGLIRRCLAELEQGWDGAVAAAPITDTVKEVGPDRDVMGTLDRSTLWAVQTPQAFRARSLLEALDVEPTRLAEATDDAALVEAAGGRVRVVEAPPENLKVTRPLDLATVEALLLERRDKPPC